MERFWIIRMMSRMRISTFHLLILMHSFAWAGKIEFTTQIQPILSENCYAAQGPFNNLGVPGAKVITLLAPEYGNQKLGEGNYNPFFARICSNPEKALVAAG